MNCPQCAAEVPEDAHRCGNCGVDLGDRPPVAEGWVRVFETSQADLIPVIESLLEGAEIPYNTEGGAMMNLYPSDFLGGVFRPSAEVKFRVPAAYAEEARALLEPSPEADENPRADSP